MGQESGSATVWVVLFMGLASVVAVTSLAFGQVVTVRHRADAAADLAALAAAGAALEAAEAACGRAASVAAAHQAWLVACARHGETADVAVEARTHLPLGLPPARARARAGPGQP